MPPTSGVGPVIVQAVVEFRRRRRRARSRLSAITARRSHSLTRRSAAPVIIVVPSAWVASTASTGISSTRAGTIRLSIVKDCKALQATSRHPWARPAGRPLGRSMVTVGAGAA